MNFEFFSPLQLDKNEILSRFTQAKNWQERYRQLMLLGKLLPQFPPEFYHPQAQVKGCESQAWLYHVENNGQHFFIGDSDARIVKGLIVLLILAYNNKNSSEIKQFNHDEYFTTLGLSGQLSPSRTNGLHALIKAIHSYVCD